MKYGMKVVVMLSAGLGLLLAGSPARGAGVSDGDAAKIRAAVPDKPRVKTEKPRKVLVFNLCKGFRHDAIPYGVKMFEAIAEKTGAFEVTSSEDIGMFAPAKLDAFDVVVMNNTTGDLFGDDPRAAELKKSLMAFVKGGKGIVGVHAATDCFYNWPEYGQMMGGYFNGHPWHEKVGVRLDLPNDPLLAAFEGKGFEVSDEIYTFKEPYSRKDLRVLQSLDPQKTNLKKGNRKDGDYAVAWVRSWGQGRVFYCSLGHDHQIYWTPALVQFYMDGLQFAAGDLKADTTPGGEAPAATPAPQATIDQLLQDFAKYEFGQSRQKFTELQELARQAAANEDSRKAFGAKLAAMLTNPDVTQDAKSMLCRILWVVGGDESVPALAGLLGQADLSDMARYGLERMPSPAAGVALRDAMGQVKGACLLGVINSVGERRDAQAADALIALLGDSDAPTALAAVKALGKIAGPKAAAALAKACTSGSETFQAAAKDAYLKCADQLLADGQADPAAAIYRALFAAGEPAPIRVAALQGLVTAKPQDAAGTVLELLTGKDPMAQAMASRFVREMKGQEATKAFAGELPKMSPSAQVLVIGALAERGDPAALPAIVDALQSADPAVCKAALTALGDLGDVSTVAVLAKQSASGEEALRELARQSLARLRGQAVDGAIVAALKAAAPEAQVELIQALAARRAAGAADALLAAAGSDNAAVSAEAVKALAVLADEKAAPALIALLVQAKEAGPREAAERAVVAIALRATDPVKCAEPVLAALASATPEAKASLLRVAGRIGGEPALAAVRAALKDDNAAVQDAAVRGLAEWTTPDALDDLLTLAKTAKSPTHRVLALRGYVRLAGLSPAQGEQKIKLYQSAMAAATREEDKKMVLGALAQAQDAAALKMVEPYLSDPALAAEAALAAIRIAQSTAASNPDLTKEVLEKVIQSTQDANIKKAAEEALAIGSKFQDYLVAWQYCGPYTKDELDGSGLFDVAFAPEKTPASVAWKPMPVGTNPGMPFLLELDKAMGGQNRVAYLRTNVWSPVRQEVLLEMGSDDGIKVWLNGKVAYGNNAVRPCAPGSDKAKVTLDKGWNTLLVKVTQGGGEWQACLRLRTADGQRLVNIRVQAGPPQTSMIPPAGGAIYLAVETKAEPAESVDPVLGEYQGKYVNGSQSAAAVGRVIPDGDDNYRIALTTKGDKPLWIDLAGKLKDGTLEMAGQGAAAGWTGKLADKTLQAAKGDAKFDLKFFVRTSATLGAKAPEGAIVLLPYEPGKAPSMDAWRNKTWKALEDGSMEVGRGNNMTVKDFADCKLHLEFRIPYEPTKHGQARGNSGVYFQGRYEVQVLDSFGLVPRDNECGGIYSVAVPKEYAALPPLTWQTYDVTFHAPRFDADGKMTHKPTITVLFNGIQIHENQEIPHPTVAAAFGDMTPTGPLMLQDHGNKVRYRNIWIVELKE